MFLWTCTNNVTGTCKKNVEKATVRINRKEEKIRQYKSYLRQLMMDIESDKAVVDKNESLCNSLSMALKK